MEGVFMYKIQCKWCGNITHKTQNGYFCNSECANEYQKSLHWEKRFCDHCGKEYLFELNQKNRNGRGKYCSKECHYASGHFTKKCETCGKEFSGLKFFESIRRYCSPICAGNAPRKIKLTCVICGVQYFRVASHAENSKTCSRECLHKLITKERPVLTCFNCGKEFSPIFPSMVKRYKDKPACSRQCAGELKRTGGAKKRPDLATAEWARIRAEVIERDDYRCKRCGTGNNLTVHHITKYDICKEHKHDNLITLCKSCHKIVENLQIPY